ncbi:type I secretion system permease/ATPase [Ovoidimarina sediminis]|uniref:type I secretion system permease/ATPase n=1 Tax=Ovoidimarina sediminis TaxID=3079856 RepID=UPI00290C34CC|nr:type I secretion system permease/ATPase [Rhodophyticola sp. MJ-SS7]MDU8943115.1 type I secretion system permease/ATPase [Rhodophyticola sp. MJ-SS7]
MAKKTTPGTGRSELALSRVASGGLFRSTLLFSIFTNLLMLTGPLFMLQVYDRVLASRSEETLLALFGLVAILYFFYGLLEYARGRVMARVGARFQTGLGPRIFEAIVARSAMIGAKGPAKGSLQDLEAIRNFLSSPALLALFDVPWTPVFLIAIFIFHPLLGWLAVAGGGLLILVALANQLLTRKAQDVAQGKSGAATRFAQQAEAGAPLIRAQGMQPAMTARWQAMQADAVSDSLSAQDRTGGFTSFSKAFRFFLQSAMLAVGAWLVLQTEVTAGAMIAASILLGRALAPVEQTIGQWAVVQRARLGRANLAELLDEVPEEEERTPLPPPAALLEVTNLGLASSPGQPPILQGINFDVQPGEAVGVIGRSGAGKTTLARLLTGLTRPTVGEIRLNKATLDQYGPEALGRYLGYLPQDVVLFEGTIAENIARMATDPDPESVVKAAQRARVHEIILKLPAGYDTRLVPGDPRLSGGQKQRLALARAIYDDPVFLVLDEPNSALDNDGSEALNAVVTDMKAEGKAVVIMTHRPTAISACDRLLVVDGGKAVAFGPRDEVIKSMMRNAEDVSRVVKRGAAKP